MDAERENRLDSGPEQVASGREKGKFKPGVSGNPGGRPKGDIARLIRERTQDGKQLVDFWCNVLDNKVPGLEGQAKVADMTRVSEVMAERGWGKAPQQLEHTNPDGGGLVVQVVSYKPEGET